MGLLGKTYLSQWYRNVRNKAISKYFKISQRIRINQDNCMTLFDIEDKSVLVKDDINMVVNGLLNKRINKQN